MKNNSNTFFIQPVILWYCDMPDNGIDGPTHRMYSHDEMLIKAFAETSMGRANIGKVRAFKSPNTADQAQEYFTHIPEGKFLQQDDESLQRIKEKALSKLSDLEKKLLGLA